MPQQRADEVAIEVVVGVVQDERRLGEEGERAARGDVGVPDGLAARPAMQRQPVLDDGAGIGAGERRVGGAQMPEPAEGMQLAQPVLRGRADVEGRFAARLHDMAGEGEAAAIDFHGDGRVGGAQIGRRDQELRARRRRAARSRPIGPASAPSRSRRVEPAGAMQGKPEPVDRRDR